MKQKPTTFELAQLAAQAAAPNARPKDAVRRAMELWQEAEVQIGESENRAEYIRGLFQSADGRNIPIFTDSPKDWTARLKAYPGDERDVERALWDKTFSTESVAKRLFKDKTLTRANRHKLLLGLAKLCIRYDMEGPWVVGKGRLKYLGGGALIPDQEGFPIHPQNLEITENSPRERGTRQIPAVEVEFVRQVEALLSNSTLYAHLVRWAVEVRQRALREAKKRVIPASLRGRREDDGEDFSIQLKPKFRQ
jgi:hypothetical protein